MKGVLNICSRGRLELQPGRLNATEPTVVAAERSTEGIRERDTIKAEVREGFVETPIAAGTFVQRGNLVTSVLESNRVEHRFYMGLLLRIREGDMLI